MLPHLFQVRRVRQRVGESDKSLSASLLLAILYMLGIRALLPNANALLLAGSSTAKSPSAARANGPTSKAVPVKDEAALAERYQELVSLCRALLVEIQAKPEQGQDEYAVQALDLLASYFPLLQGRLAPAPPQQPPEPPAPGITPNGDSSAEVPPRVSTFGEEARLQAIETATAAPAKGKPQAPKLSSAICSLHISALWTSCRRSHIWETRESLAEELGRFKLAKMEKHDGAFHALHAVALSAEEEAAIEEEEEKQEALRARKRQTRAGRQKEQTVVPLDVVDKRAERVNELVEQDYAMRSLGRQGLLGRLRLVAALHRGLHALAEEPEAEDPGAHRPLPIARVLPIVEETAQELQARHDAAREAVQSQATADEPSARILKSHDLILTLLDIELAMATEQLLEEALARLVVRPEATSTLLSIFLHLQQADPGVIQLCQRALELRFEHGHRLLSGVFQATRCRASEAIFPTTLCAGAVLGGKMLFELYAIKVRHGQCTRAELESVSAALHQTSLAVAGITNLAPAARRDAFMRGVKAGDMRTASAQVLALFARELKRWKGQCAPMQGDEAPEKPSADDDVVLRLLFEEKLDWAEIVLQMCL